VQKGDFELSIGWSSQGATPLNFYRGVMSSETVEPTGTTGTENWQRYASKDADGLLDQFAATSDAEEQKAIVAKLAMAYATEVPAIPLFPGPQWGEFNTKRFTGFPDESNPYGLLSTYEFPDRLILMTTIEPKPAS
jgi:peptide/nickel transport system substrate-binding protein